MKILPKEWVPSPEINAERHHARTNLSDAKAVPVLKQQPGDSKPLTEKNREQSLVRMNQCRGCGLLGISCLLVRRALFPLSSSRPFV